MKIQLIETARKSDITRLVPQIVWSGDTKQAARKLEIEVIASSDINIPKVNLSPGNMLKLAEDNGAELFTGYIFAQERTVASNTVRVTAYDGLIYMLKSKATYNFKNTTAEAIAGKVAKDFGIEIMELIKTGIIQNLVVSSQTPYAIITGAYAAAGQQNGKKYLCTMKNNKLVIREKGAVTADFLLSSHLNITSACYTESIENMVNRVKIYDAGGESTGKVENEEWVRNYGMIQEVLHKEAGQDWQTAAKNMLKGLARSGNISALGNTGCLSGTSVKIQEPFTGLSGLFEIDTDCHIWQEGRYTMDLGLHFSGMEGEE